MLDLSRITLRLPEEPKSWLSGRAKGNVRSLNNEIVRILLEHKDRDEKAASA